MESHFLKTFKIGEAADGYLLKSLNVCLVKVRGGVLVFAVFFCSSGILYWEIT